jgi:predicted porin
METYKMIKSFVALLAIGATANAAAADVSIYGSIDGGLRNMTNVDAAGNSRLSMNSPGIFKSSRFGFLGKEDLGNGMNAHMNLESRYKASTGEQVGVLFNVVSSVGVGGAWGTVDLGKQFTLAFKTISAYDTFGIRYTGIVHAINATMGVSDNNSIQYTGGAGPYVVRLMYGAGEQAGSTRNGATYAAAMSYREGAFSYGGAYTHKTSVTGLDTSHYTLGGAYLFGKARASAGYARQSDEVAGRADTVTKYSWAGLAYNVTAPLQLIGAYYLTTKDQALAPQYSRKGTYILSATYALSKRTNLYAEVDRNKYTGSFITTGHSGQTGVSAGVNHDF